MGAAPLTSPPATRASATLNLEWKPDADTAADLQGVVVSAYPKQLFGMLMMVQFPAAPHAAPNKWTAHLTPRITDATGARDFCLNVAFSAAGLDLLRLESRVLATFSRPFQEGMTTENRARFLGDQPTNWTWSDCASNHNCVHAVLLVYALDEPSLTSLVNDESATLAGFGLTLAGKILMKVNLSPDNQRHEHFGFADGLSQPKLIDGTIPVAQRGLHEIPVGEVVLGQINTHDSPASGPIVPSSSLAAQYLKPASTTEGFFDLGLNGTYLVVRQLRQDVARFWNNMKAASADLLDEGGRPATDEWLAQKAVGRTLDGKMLAVNGAVDGNDMTFQTTDPAGFGCPITSHVRRANPRDGLASSPANAQEMIRATNRHRIVRRGRIYGAPIQDRYVDDGVDRGLLFMCMNSEIERQFEFVQNTWLLNPMFGFGYNESDPILGTQCPFRIPSKPVRQQPIIETFVTPFGGGYFFMPSLRALRYLSAL